MLFGVALAALLTLCGIRGGGGSQPGPTTEVEIIVDLLAAALAGFALVANIAQRWWGVATLTCFGALLGVTAVSITIAVQPSDAWLETNRTASYLAAFGCGVVLVRLGGAWWNALLSAICAAAVAVSVWALLTKIFPGALAADEIYARLRQPYGYWNAVGLTAALGVPPALWLGARRSGHGAISAMAYPVMGVLLLTVLLAYSRGALLAIALGCCFWFAVVPLRLRGVAVLGSGAVGALLVAAWAFAQDTLTQDKVPITQRATSGHELGVAVVVMVLLLAVVGLAANFAAARRAPSAPSRRRAGVAIVVAVAIVPIVATTSLALSSKGLVGSVSSGWKELTDPKSTAVVTNDPSRLTKVGSVRARYWNEAYKIWRSHEWTGVGAGGYATARLRLRTDQLAVRHAHGYVVQTAADLGIAGLLASAALLAAWLAASARTLGWWPRGSRSPFGPEHVALASLAALVVIFGAHSFIDWTWFVPGNAVVALLAAGWMAGRGPLLQPAAQPDAVRRALRSGMCQPRLLCLAAMPLALGLVAAWTAWQPQRALDAGNRALQLAADGPSHLATARRQAAAARAENPLSIDPLLDEALVDLAAHNRSSARGALQAAVQLQPANPAAWEALVRFTLDQDHNPKRALRLLGPAIYLDPQSPPIRGDYLDALRAAQAQADARARAAGSRGR